jgi:hypothetical protein
MRNLDDINKQKTQIFNDLTDAVKTGDEEKFAKSFTDLADTIQQAVIAEAQGLIQSADNTVLAGRGARILTSEENKYYQAIIDAMKSNNPKQALNDLTVVMPKTTIDLVFEDLTEAHPILSVINFQNTGALTEFIVNNGYAPAAVWGELTGEIVTEITSSFSKIELSQNKLSAFLPIAKPLLDLGPVWLDRYIRAILGDALASGLETGIVDGDGKSKPIGMTRALSGAVDGEYPRKEAVPISSLDPDAYSGILEKLSTVTKTLVVGNETKTIVKHRPVSKIILVVNPTDYFTKIMPATTIRNSDGGYNNNVFPFPTTVIQSTAVPAGKAIFGIAEKYFFGLGMAKEGKIEYSDEYRFLEDQRVYRIKMYGAGKPLDENAFVYADISGIRPVYPIVRVSDYVDARVSSITLTDEKTNAVDIGTVSENIHYYSGSVADVETAGDNNAAVLDVTPNDSTATVTVKLNGTGVAAEADGTFELTLTAGQNVVVITVAIDGVSEAYVVVIDYTPKA